MIAKSTKEDTPFRVFGDETGSISEQDDAVIS